LLTGTQKAMAEIGAPEPDLAEEQAAEPADELPARLS